MIRAASDGLDRNAVLPDAEVVNAFQQSPAYAANERVAIAADQRIGDRTGALRTVKFCGALGIGHTAIIRGLRRGFNGIDLDAGVLGVESPHHGHLLARELLRRFLVAQRIGFLAGPQHVF